MKNVLVAYATRMGATAEIAEAIADELRSADLAVDVRACSPDLDAAGYDAVVIGSPVYLNRWLKDAVDYLKRHATELSRRPVWLFQSGPCGEGAADEQIGAPVAVRKAAILIGTDPPRTFGGRLDRTKATGPVSRWMATGTYEGDFRDFDKIRAWASSIAGELTQPSSNGETRHRPAVPQSRRRHSRIKVDR
ncbi:flavodoxin domain-containing protein [Microlunatus panaciterrae]|uniref:Menaquinone-dependent protoporphyrinogen oxidase n=1 Tax=Microlunatus panaciterrae TaxID=400768 RepID=A0ABS2RHJ6_9ACTN|nr:flavodoxin domain-containing protein [Microlunatus panaciterrae]MBM7797671.1 menaquinone-dependent protoporphyrinogen oxidase [Microlunatus panaciterrae]